jgi:Neuraminidase-like domain/ABC toxin N-terminal region
MNLEPRVAPSAINAKQWEWMKRYRVWEANRKVFLWPENWCEPELRDDQSPFFKETMSELLQSDITEDRAATALLNYLSKLEEVAKLEPCGIHYVESEPGTTDNIAHVVARTSGAKRKYYYRRREGGSWRPWEQIKLDIEDNPVIPVVWKGRLFLFWLKILKQAPLQKPQLPDGALASLVPSTDISTDPPNVTVQAVLCWSEYYNCKWQPTKTSDVNKPAKLGNFKPEEIEFLRPNLEISVFEEEGSLRVSISGYGGSSFLLYNTHSLPLRGEPGIAPSAPSVTHRSLQASEETFYINYWLGESVLKREVLEKEITGQTIQPQHDLQNLWEAPFFYEDSRHVFYVTTTDRIVRLPDHDGFYLLKPSHIQGHIEPVVLEQGASIPDKVGPLVQPRGFGIENRAVIERFVSEDTYIDKAVGTLGTIRYGEVAIGISGGLDKAQNQ